MPIRMAATGDERRNKLLRRTGSAQATMARQRQRRSFSMLADDILVTIYRLLGDYPSSRARFAAVCRSWRAAVASEPRVPVLPWLLLSPREVGGDRTRLARCLEDGAVMRICPRPGVVGRRLVGGYDGCWVISCHPPPIRIVNLFSGAELALPEKLSKIACPRRDHGRGDTRCPIVVSKVVFSEPPTSDGCIMAAMTENCGIALCRVGCPEGGWTIHGCQVESFRDIAFCNGELYGVTRDGHKVVKFDITLNKKRAPMITGDTRVALQMVSRHKSRNSCKEYSVYLVDLHGKLAIAMMTWWLLGTEPFFKVYQLVDNETSGTTTCCNNKWEEVTSLGDHALFLGQIFSKVVHVPMDMCGDVERNRIYYSNNSCRSLNAEVHGDAVKLTISYENGDLKYEREKRTSIADYDEKITSVGYFMKCGRHDIMWLLPPDI
ncbi:hypothetical protein ACQ4PT_046765 [Festuca glaucescens]